MTGGLHPPPEIIKSWPSPNYINPETHGRTFTIIVPIFGLLATVCVLARFWGRAVIQKTTGIDDWLILASLIPTLGLAVILTLGVEIYGLNRHVWDNPSANLAIQRQITMAAEACFIASSGLIKLSILLFYRRLANRSFSRTFLLITWASIISVIVFTLASFVILFLSCQPFDAYWNQFNTTLLKSGYRYHCINEPIFILSIAGISTVQDLLATTIPAVLCWHLKLPRAQKAALAAIFTTGYFVCAISALRIYSVYRVFLGSYDVLWEAWYAWLATALEILVASICASLPALRVFLPVHEPKNTDIYTRRNSFRSYSARGSEGTRGKAGVSPKMKGWRTATPNTTASSRWSQQRPPTASTDGRGWVMDRRQTLPRGVATVVGVGFDGQPRDDWPKGKARGGSFDHPIELRGMERVLITTEIDIESLSVQRESRTWRDRSSIG